MATINTNFLKLQSNYLFADIARKVANFKDSNPDSRVISLGIGDVTRPLAPAVVEAFEKAAREMGCGVVLFGHTHRPTLEERDGILLMNPGTAQRGYAALLTVDEAGKAMGELLSF